MLKDSYWLETGETVFELKDKEGKYVATLSYNEYDECWQIENDDYFEWIGTDNSDTAKDIALESLSEHYNN